LHRDRPDPGLNLAFWPMAMPNQTVTPVRQLHALHRGEECLNLGLDGLSQQSAGAAAQNGRQRVVDCIGLTEETTVLSLVMEYRPLREFRQAFTRLDTPPLSIRHHPDSAIARHQPSLVQAIMMAASNNRQRM
jgi:hypothetical protein